MNIYDTHGNLLYASKAKTLRGAVEEAVRKGVALTRANLDAANLYLASLIRANLEGASLKGAYLEGAYLAGANLAGANLEGASLEGAGCYKANLEGASLKGATFIGAKLAATTGIIDTGTDSRGHRWVAVQHDDGPRIKAGCRWYTLSEAHEHWDGPHELGEIVGIECRSRLALLETLAKSKGWVK